MTEEQREQKHLFNCQMGKRIADLRKSEGLTQEQLSLKAGLQRSHVSRIEAGKYDVTAFTIELIANALGYTVGLIEKTGQ
jgi:transcriptional regulator with XRE-family HTH domain